MKRLYLALPCLLLFSLSTTLGQGVGKTDKQVDDIKNEILQFRKELDSLKTTRNNFLLVQPDEIETLDEKYGKRIQLLENKIDAISRSTAPTVFNPRITVFTNFAGRVDDKTVFDAEDIAEIHNRPFLRTVELDFRAPVDPYAEAITVLALEDEAGTGFAVDVEEAYGIIKRLPVFEAAPLGLKMKLGKFRAPFGVNNKLHMHDLPWTTRPLVVSKYLGTEHGEFFESGFNPVGIDFDLFLPNPISTTTLEMNLSIVRSSELGLGQSLNFRQPAYLGHLTLSKDWNNEHLIVIGGSAYLERGDDAPRLFGADMTYKWSPAEQRQWQSVVLGGEIFFGKNTLLDTVGNEIVNKPFGYFAYGQYQLSFWTYLGVRYDWLKEPSDDHLITKAISAYVSYYTTEFLRFRLGFQRLMSDVLDSDRNNVNSVLFEVNFVFGSHPVEPYWVNR